MPIIKKGKKERPKQTLSLNSIDVPDIKNWSVGEEYEVVLRVKQTSARQVDKWDIEEYGYKKGDIRAEFEVASVKSVGPSKKKKGMYVETRED